MTTKQKNETADKLLQIAAGMAYEEDFSGCRIKERYGKTRANKLLEMPLITLGDYTGYPQINVFPYFLKTLQVTALSKEIEAALEKFDNCKYGEDNGRYSICNERLREAPIFKGWSVSDIIYTYNLDIVLSTNIQYFRCEKDNEKRVIIVMSVHQGGDARYNLSRFHVFEINRKLFDKLDIPIELLTQPDIHVACIENLYDFNSLLEAGGVYDENENKWIYQGKPVEFYSDFEI